MRKMTVRAMTLRMEPKFVICARSPWATMTILPVSMACDIWPNRADWSTPNRASISWMPPQIAWNLTA